MSTRSNQRRHARVQAPKVTATVRVGAQHAVACLLDNISRGGLFLRTERHVPVGTPVVLSLVRAGWKRALEVTGRVSFAQPAPDARARGAKAGVGVAFDPLPAAALERLDDLLLELGAPDPTEAITIDDDGDLESRVHELAAELEAKDREIARLEALVSERDAELARLRPATKPRR